MFTAIIPASGRGERFGGETPKQFLPLKGRPLFLYTLLVFAKHPLCEAIILVIREEYFDFVEFWLSSAELSGKVYLVTGGETRQESVYQGVREAHQKGYEVVLIHDAVRPLVTESLITAIYEKTLEKGVAIPVIPVRDALVRIEGEKYSAPLSRENLFLVQTPQGARTSILKSALEWANAQRKIFADEGSLLHSYGQEIAIVPGLLMNFKITYPEDLILAERLIAC